MDEWLYYIKNRRLYYKKPLDVISDIPIFSKYDDYIKNYDLISSDHINSINHSGLSPFMSLEQILVSHSETQFFITKYTQPHQNILDAGIGLGDLLVELPQFNRFGVDISLGYLQIAKSKGINVALAKIEELPYCDEYFDTLVACDVMEHVLRLDLCIEQMMRVLKPGGYMIIRVPNEEVLDSYFEENEKYCHSHVRQFSLVSLRLYLEKCFGLKHIESKAVGFLFTNFPQMRFQFPSINNELHSKLSKIFQQRPELFNIEAFIELNKLHSSTFEVMGDALLSIKESYPDIFKSLAPDLIKPLEFIAVFKKI